MAELRETSASINHVPRSVLLENRFVIHEGEFHRILERRENECKIAKLENPCAVRGGSSDASHSALPLIAIDISRIERTASFFSHSVSHSGKIWTINEHNQNLVKKKKKIVTYGGFIPLENGSKMSPIKNDNWFQLVSGIILNFYSFHQYFPVQSNHLHIFPRIGIQTKFCKMNQKL